MTAMLTDAPAPTPRLTTTQVQARLNAEGLPACKETVRRLGRRGDLDAVKIGKRWLYTAESLERLLNPR